MANDLLTHQRIETTLAKTKVLRTYVEPLITLAKNNKDSVTARRQAFRKLVDKETVKVLFDDIGPLFKDTPGGYTRTMTLGNRRGDGARMAIIELTKRTIPDDEIIGVPEEKVKTRKIKPGDKKKTAKNAVKTEDSAKEDGKTQEKHHAAPEVDIAEQEERAVEEVKKEKAKNEQKKVEKRGFFRRFNRKSMG